MQGIALRRECVSISCVCFAAMPSGQGVQDAAHLRHHSSSPPPPPSLQASAGRALHPPKVEGHG